MNTKLVTLLAAALVGLPFALAHGGVDPGEVVDPNPLSAARALYGAGVTIQPVTVPEFSAAFPTAKLYEAVDERRVPRVVHYMAWLPALLKGHDFTRGFNGLLADTGAVIATAADAERLARAFAVLGNAEIETGRGIVTSADASWLGYAPGDPSATSSLNAWTVTLETWSEENGVRARWELRFEASRATRATWSILDVEVGPGDLALDAPTLRPGHEVVNTYAAQGYTLAGYMRDENGTPTPVPLPEDVLAATYVTYMTGQNFDNSNWTAQFPEGFTVPENLATLAADAIAGGIYAYSEEIGASLASCAGRPNPQVNWSFYANDSNCNMEIRFDDPQAIFYCYACISDSEGTDDVVIYLSPFIQDGIGKGTFRYPDYRNATRYPQPEFMRVVMAHELMHHIQYVLEEEEGTSSLQGSIEGRPPARWISWKGLSEGMPRAMQTLLTPETDEHPKSGWYADSSDYHGAPEKDFCGADYATAPYWGYVYKRFGLETLRETMIKADDVDGNVDSCAVGIMRALNAALGGDVNGTALAQAHFWDFIENEFGPRNYTWASPFDGTPRDWGEHFEDVSRKPYLQDGPGTGSVTLGAFGWALADLPLTGSYDVSCTGDVNARVLLKNATGVHDHALTCNGAARFRIDRDAYEDATLAGLRTLAGQAVFGVTVHEAT